MKNKANDIQAIKFINLISYTSRRGKLKKQDRTQKQGVAILYDVF